MGERFGQGDLEGAGTAGGSGDLLARERAQVGRRGRKTMQSREQIWQGRAAAQRRAGQTHLLVASCRHLLSEGSHGAADPPSEVSRARTILDRRSQEHHADRVGHGVSPDIERCVVVWIHNDNLRRQTCQM